MGHCFGEYGRAGVSFFQLRPPDLFLALSLARRGR